MTTKRAPLNSEQALDEYFFALLEEEVAPEPPPSVSTEPKVQPIAAVTLPTVESKPYAELQSEQQIQLQKLLSQVATDDATATETLVETHLETATDDLDPAWQAALAEEAARDAVTLSQLAEPVVETVVAAAAKTAAAHIVDVEQQLDTETAIETEHDSQPAGTNWHNIETGFSFQVLYFLVSGVTFAVPLTELGGIHRLADTNTLIGRPGWYLGLQTSREQQLDIVDTARWVMPDKIMTDEHRDAYQYIVMLGDSTWGLASDKLMGTETLVKEDVRWRESEGKRPWLAGMVKEKMCALIHVEAMINMLNAGLDVNGVA